MKEEEVRVPEKLKNVAAEAHSVRLQWRSGGKGCCLFRGLLRPSVRGTTDAKARVECVCLTHHEMWLGQYPSELFSLVVLWVAGDLFQYLKTQRQKRASQEFVFKPQFFFFFTPKSHTGIQSRLSTALYLLHLGQRTESDPTTSQPPPRRLLPHLHGQCETNFGRHSASQGERSFAPPPALLT